MKVKTLRFIDKYLIGFFILCFFWLKYFFVGKQDAIISHPKRILVIRLWAMGSSLLTFPMIKQLEDHYGNNVIYDLLATSRNIGVFQNQGYFDHMYNLFSLKGIGKVFLNFKRYDIIIDAEEYFRISSLLCLWLGKITIGYSNIVLRKLAYLYSYQYSEISHNMINCLNLLSPLGIHIIIPNYMESLVYKHKHTIKVDVFLQQFNGKKIICFHTGGAETSSDRFWSNDNRILLIKYLYKQYGDNIIILLSGTKFEQESVGEIIQALSYDVKHNVFSLCGMFNLFEFAYLLTKCDLMVSNDTGPMHLAAAMRTKTIGLFGPNLPQIFGPWPLDENMGLYAGGGKIYIKPHLGIFKKDIEYSINNISVDRVLSSVLSILGK